MTNTETEEKKPKKKLTKVAKEVINIIRTTQRNNIELTAIADNKANVLLSLNGLMIAAIVPLVLANVDFVFERHLSIPLLVLAATCFATIYISAQVLKPSNFEDFRTDVPEGDSFSPFFFGNFYNMEPQDYFDYLGTSLQDTEMVKKHLSKDLFFVGRRLGKKMKNMRLAFNIFLWGIFATLISLIAVIASY